MNWRVLITDPISEVGIERLRQEAEVMENGSLEQLDEFDALIVRGGTRVGRPQIEAGRPRLKVIGRAGVGVDNIDLVAAAANEVLVVNAPLAATNAVAEHALGLMFALARGLTQTDRLLKEGRWEKDRLQGIELSDRVLGILGMGRIGQALAEKATALGMMPLGHDPRFTPPEIRDRGASPVTLLELFARSDFVSVHVPLTQMTRHIVSENELDGARKGLYLINTARGGIVDEEALLRSLNSGKLAGAALDVFEHEPPGASRLVQHPNVIATPHVGAQTEQAQARAAADIAEEVLAALKGEPLRWRVQ
jgi:D-3-phosphoglycerate dehydrogenase